MKRITEILSLLLALLMLVASLFACDSFGGGDDDDDDENEDSYRNLSPEELYEKLKTAESYSLVYTYEMSSESEDEHETEKITIELNNGLLMATSISVYGEGEEAEEHSETIYYDTEERFCYEYDEYDDIWNGDVADDYDIKEAVSIARLGLFADVFGEDFAYEDDKFDKKDGAYTLKQEYVDEILDEAYGYIDSFSFEIKNSGKKYTFTLNAGDGDNEVTLTAVLNFAKPRVKLPENVNKKEYDRYDITVTDQNGNAIEEARVTAYGDYGNAVYYAYTDEKGKAIVYAEQGEIEVGESSYIRISYYTDEENVDYIIDYSYPLTDREMKIEIRRVEYKNYTVTVESKNGEPIYDVRVAMFKNGEYGEERIDYNYTDEDGKVVFYLREDEVEGDVFYVITTWDDYEFEATYDFKGLHTEIRANN